MKKILVVYHAKNSGATKSILHLKGNSSFSFFQLNKNINLFSRLKIILLILSTFNKSYILLNGLAIFANPLVISAKRTFKNKKIVLYWHEGEYQWNETLISYNLNIDNLEKLKNSIKKSYNIFDSAKVKNWAKKKFKIDRSSFLLPECFDFDGFTKSREQSSISQSKLKTDERINVLCVGAICKRKGFDIFLDLAEKTDDRFEFHWLGKKVEFSNENHIRINSINDSFKYSKIKLFDYTPNTQNHFINTNIFLLPSLDEPFGIVYLEALSFGKYIVVSPNSGFAHELQDKTIGYVYKDFNELLFFFSSVSRQLLEDESLSQKRIEFSKQYDYNMFQKRLTKILNEITNKKI